MNCQSPIGCCQGADISNGCSGSLYILADRIFDSCRQKITLRDIRFSPDTLCPCDDCPTGAPEEPITFDGGSSSCSDAVISCLDITDQDQSCGSCNSCSSCGCSSCGCSSSCGCHCDSGLRRVRGKLTIPMKLYYRDCRCRRFFADECISVPIDLLLRMPTNAQIPAKIEALASAMVCGACECDGGIIATIEIALFIFVVGRTAIEIPAGVVTSIPACRRPSDSSCRTAENCLDQLPLFPSPRTSSYILNPSSDTSSGNLYPPGNSTCPLAD